MASFRKHFNTSVSRPKGFSFRNRGSNIATSWWTNLVKIMTKLTDRELAVLTPDEFLSFWGDEDRLNAYLFFLLSTIEKIDGEMKKNKNNDVVLFELLEMCSCVRNCLTYVCLFNAVNTNSGNKSLVKKGIRGFIKHFKQWSFVGELIANQNIILWDTNFITHSLEKKIHCGLELILDDKFMVNDSEVKQCVYRCAFGNRYYATNEKKDSKLNKSYSNSSRSLRYKNSVNNNTGDETSFNNPSNNASNINSINQNCSRPCQSQRLDFLEAGNNAFWFVKLEQLVAAESDESAKNVEEAFRSLQHVFELILIMAKQNATEAMVYSLSALTLAKWLLNVSPFENRVVLSEIARYVQTMSAWPAPYGYVALQVLEEIFYESKIPGRSLWMHNYDVLGERFIDIEDTDDEDDKDFNQVHIFAGENSNARSYIFQHFWDDTREINTVRKHSQLKLDALKRNLLVKFITSSIVDNNILDTIENPIGENGIDTRIVETIKLASKEHALREDLLTYVSITMPSEDVCRWHTYAFDIIGDLSRLNHHDALKHREQSITKFIQELKVEYFKTFMKRRKRDKSTNIKEFNALTSEKKEKLCLAKAKHIIEEDIIARGKVSLEYIHVKKNLLDIFGEETVQKCKEKISSLLIDYNMLQTLKGSTLSDLGSYNVVLNSFKRSSEEFNFPFNSKEDNNNYLFSEDLREFEELFINDLGKTVNICLLGGIQVIHRYICAYVSFTYKYEFEPKVRLYLIPSEHSFLAEAIAAVDPWYCRNVYVPFCYPSWTIPFVRPINHLSDEDTNFDGNNGKDGEDLIVADNMKALLTGPQKILASLKQHYLQHAESKFAVPIFMCECWERVYDGDFDGEQTNSSSKWCIPFCSSLEIGVYPELYSSKYAVDNSGNEVVHEDSYNSLTYEKDVKQLRKYLQQLKKDERKNLSRKLDLSFLKTTSKDNDYGGGRDTRRASDDGNTGKKGITIANSEALIRFSVSNIPEHENSKVRLTENYLYCSMYKVSPKCEEIIANKKNRKEIRTKDINAIEKCLTDHENASSFMANDITIKSRDGKSFHVMLDGEIFGPYTRLHIKPTRNDLKAHFLQFIPQIISTTSNKSSNNE
jgi:hypothetical protein